MQDLAADAIRDRLCTLFSLVSSSDEYEKYCVADPVRFRSHLDPLDADKVVEAGYAKRCDDSWVRRWCNPFTVYEPSPKHRRRFILHPKQLMDEMPFVSQIDIETELQEMARVYNGDWSAVDDLKISFNQVELAAQVQPYFGFQDSAGRSFVSTVMVMGNRSSPETMDDLTKVVAGCKGYAKISAGGSCDTHIDNIRYVGDFDTCVSDCALLHRNSSACNVQLNGGDFAVPCQANEFCGKFYNYATKTVRLADKQIPKLSAARDQLLRQDATVGDLEEIFGKLQWASVVLQAPTHNFYFAIKFVRRRLSALQRAFSLVIPRVTCGRWLDATSRHGFTSCCRTTRCIRSGSCHQRTVHLFSSATRRTRAGVRFLHRRRRAL